ncbi:ribonuclease HII [Bacillus massiliigorillae]|uniref:ribonuclease HII n=1 Tax=Bacillus massiliigorillae TaxID=1243664 RepID=UPI0005A8E0C6|nr:ribonuclease HII [Bacillus massiliigorillae]
MTKQKSIKEITEVLQTIDNPNDPFLLLCSQDNRKGVINAVNKWKRAYAQQEKLESKWDLMTEFERNVYNKGYQFVAGVDEVGRGPLAGPVVAAAVILPKDYKLLGLDDSKKINETKRNLFFDQIMQNAIAVGIGIMEHDVIDKINIYEATKKAMEAAIESLEVRADYLLIDAMKLPVSLPQESIIKGDARSVSISAASIIAKVTRDRLMNEYDVLYPQFGFKNNMGYGTKEHLEALRQCGPTPLHRRSFAPVKEVIHSKN